STLREAMMRRFYFRVFCWIVLAGVAGCLPVMAQQQTNPNAPPPAPKASPSRPDQNCATKGSGMPWKATSNCKPAPQAQDANPFPEVKSQKAANAANSPTKGSSGSSSSRFDLNRLNAPSGSEARISNGEGGYIHNPQLAAKDVKIGNFYLQTHDYKGAYDRFLEATRVAPEDGNAVFGLAESARGLNKTEEAI